MNNELKKKLLEWAGFKYDIWKGWIYPDGENFDEPPNLIESLDACFRWLVPKLYEFISLPDINFCMPFDENEGCLATIVDDIPGGPLSEAEAKTPALAFCLAVEKLIDSMKEL